MEHGFGPDDVYEFLKLLVELGGMQYVDGSHCIFTSADNAPVGVEIGGDKNNRKMIALYKEGTKIPPNAIYLNPFDELIGKHPENDLFLKTISVMPGVLVRATMKMIVEIINNKSKDTKFKTAALFSKFVGRVDKKFADELDKVRAIQVGAIFYDRSKHVSQLISELWDDEFAASMKSKLRKSSIKLIQDMAAEIYQTATPHEIVYTSKMLACPRFDAIVHVLSDALTRIHEPVEKLLEIDLHTEEIAEHITHMEAYHKAVQWLATSSASPMKSSEKGVVKGSNIPWTNSSPLGNVGAIGSGSGLPKVVGVGGGSSNLGNVSAVGVIENPTYKQDNGVIVNPSFSLGGIGGGAGPLGNVSPVSPVVPGLGHVGGFFR